MSTACTAGRLLPVWMAGLPTTVFCLTSVSRDPAARRMPLVLPVTMLVSTTFPVAVPMTPMPKSSEGSA
jgi:hypothetical protein